MTVKVFEGDFVSVDGKYAILVGRFNSFVVESLLEGALDALKRHHPSRPGNKLFAKIFYMMGLFENWGSGTLKIIEAAKQSSEREPDFDFQDGMFSLKIWCSFGS